MNMQNLMMQAQKIQKDLEKANIEIQNSTFVGESGVIKVEITGKYLINKIEILDDSVLSDKELFEDMLKVAFNNAINSLNKVKEEKMGKYTNGLGGLF